MGKYKVSAGHNEPGVSNASFQIGKTGIKGRVGDEVELSEDQLKQLEHLPFEFTAVDGSSVTEPPHQEQEAHDSQEAQDDPQSPPNPK